MKRVMAVLGTIVCLMLVASCATTTMSMSPENRKMVRTIRLDSHIDISSRGGRGKEWYLEAKNRGLDIEGILLTEFKNQLGQKTHYKIVTEGDADAVLRITDMSARERLSPIYRQMVYHKNAYFPEYMMDVSIYDANGKPIMHARTYSESEDKLPRIPVTQFDNTNFSGLQDFYQAGAKAAVKRLLSRNRNLL